MDPSLSVVLVAEALDGPCYMPVGGSPGKSNWQILVLAFVIVVGYAAFGVGIMVTNVNRLDRGCGIERIY